MFDREYVTAAGISADLDFSLALMACFHGEDATRTAQIVAEYALQPLFRGRQPDRSRLRDHA